MEEGHRTRGTEQTCKAVIDAAERLFAAHGFAATSMRDISEASGVSHPLIHHHFGSKEKLYAAIKRRMVEGYARRFPAAARATNRPLSVRAEMRRLMTYLLENPVMLRLCGWTRLEGDFQVWPGQPDLLESLRSRVEVAQRKGRIRNDLDAVSLSLMIFGLIYFWVENQGYMAERYKGKIDEETFLRQAIALVERGVSPAQRAVPVSLPACENAGP